MITSEYLNDAVNFKRPVLIVGPGLRSVQTNKGFIYMPMDSALIWFAENIKSRIDVFDIPSDTPWEGCHHGIDKVKDYMKGLSQRTKLTKIKYIIGDIAECRLSQKKYGTIWDHGTLEGLIFSSRSFSSDGPGEWDNGRVQKILDIYKKALRKNGKIIFSGQGSSFEAEKINLASFTTKKIRLEADKYLTSLTPAEIFPDRDMIGTIRNYIWDEGFLFPHEELKSILELTRIK
ncbi:MAG: hypothetical protein AABX24_00615 [Nanoarchaeota archaeon]